MKSIIELAREAGFNEAETEILKQEITSFAAIVRAEDEALLRQALEALNHVNVQDRVQIIAALRQRLGETK